MGTHPIFESDFDCLTEMGENDENKPSTEQGQLPSYEQSIQIPEDDKPELPPAYSASVKLPTYEKACNDIPFATPNDDDQNNTSDDAPQQNPPLTSEFLRRLILHQNGYTEEVDRDRLGNDWHFILYFIIAFLFNWVGLFCTFCCSNTVAARYGGLSGFGLSLVKWISIYRYDPELWSDIQQPAGEDTIDPNFSPQAFIYIFMFIGLLLFFKGAFTWCRFRHLQAPVVQVRSTENPIRRVVIQRNI